jgi:hypothetical protein
VDEVHRDEVREPQAAGDEAHDAEPVGGLVEEVFGQPLAAERRGIGGWVADLGLDKARAGSRELGAGSHGVGDRWIKGTARRH